MPGRDTLGRHHHLVGPTHARILAGAGQRHDLDVVSTLPLSRPHGVDGRAALRLRPRGPGMWTPGVDRPIETATLADPLRIGLRAGDSDEGPRGARADRCAAPRVDVSGSALPSGEVDRGVHLSWHR